MVVIMNVNRKKVMFFSVFFAIVLLISNASLAAMGMTVVQNCDRQLTCESLSEKSCFNEVSVNAMVARVNMTLITITYPNGGRVWGEGMPLEEGEYRFHCVKNLRWNHSYSSSRIAYFNLLNLFDHGSHEGYSDGSIRFFIGKVTVLRPIGATRYMFSGFALGLHATVDAA